MGSAKSRPIRPFVFFEYRKSDFENKFINQIYIYQCFCSPCTSCKHFVQYICNRVSGLVASSERPSSSTSAAVSSIGVLFTAGSWLTAWFVLWTGWTKTSTGAQPPHWDIPFQITTEKTMEVFFESLFCILLWSTCRFLTWPCLVTHNWWWSFIRISIRPFHFH